MEIRKRFGELARLQLDEGAWDAFAARIGIQSSASGRLHYIDQKTEYQDTGSTDFHLTRGPESCKVEPYNAQADGTIHTKGQRMPLLVLEVGNSQEEPELKRSG
ncbi:MAG: hypothetical protein Q9168_002205 [Polycauliona sp. 1 TL-2023]